MSKLYGQSKSRQASQKEAILKMLKLAGENGVLNTELNKIMLRFGEIISQLRDEGYDISTDGVGKRGLVKYTLLNKEPHKRPERKKGIDIVREAFNSDDFDGHIYFFELENILHENGLQITHLPNRKNRPVTQG